MEDGRVRFMVEGATGEKGGNGVAFAVGSISSGSHVSVVIKRKERIVVSIDKFMCECFPSRHFCRQVALHQQLRLRKPHRDKSGKDHTTQTLLPHFNLVHPLCFHNHCTSGIFISITKSRLIERVEASARHGA